MEGSCYHLPLILPLTWKVTAPMLWLLPILTSLAEAAHWPRKVSLLILHWEGTRRIAFLITTQGSHLRGQSVIVPKTDFLHSDGVILIDNGDGIVCQQLLEAYKSKRCKEVLVVAHEMYLAHCSHSLPLSKVGWPLSKSHLLTTNTYGSA
ncbi:MAG: hypothetical protein FRX49_06749 [Trebouxia sp. A1-2]|nr:MAG: hypothetical protein FRX49_06749 [Trebouxia sp. A1-2]